jgi:NADPH-dependent F420 reductase
VKIGIVGGTGEIGEGIAMRLSSIHEVIIGSREHEKAEISSQCCYDEVTKRGLPCHTSGEENQAAIDAAEIVILAIPYKNLDLTLPALHGFEGKLVISPINPMEKREYFVYTPPTEGSAALRVQNMLPESTSVCAAFNTIAANRWRALDEILDYAVPVCGDNDTAKLRVMELVNSISMLHAYNAGPLAASNMVESLTPLLLNIARYNKMRDVGIQFR